MQPIPNPMATLYQNQLQASRRFADALFSGTEKLDRLVLEATHRVVNDQLTLAQAVASGQNPANTGLASNLAQRNSGHAMNYQAEFMRVVAEMQAEIGRSMQEYIEQVGTQASGTEPGQKAAVAAAAASSGEEVSNPMSAMLSLWESAFNEATAMANRNMEAVRSNAQRATESGMNLVGNAARTAAGEAARRGADGASSDGARRR